MKRFIAFLCVLAVLSSLAACGSGEEETTVESIAAQSVSQEEALPEENTSAAETKASEEAEVPAVAVPFEEIIVVDNEHCTIKVTGIDADNMWGYTLKAYLENKSADKTFMFSVISAAVNGVEIDPMFASEVAAGKKSNEEITFMSDELNMAGIEEYTDIELNFRVYDTNDWSADDVAQASVHVYPYGEEGAVRYERKQQIEDIILADNEYATVVVADCEWDNIWGYSVNLFIENKSDVSIMVAIDEASVNGYMVDPFYADSVSAGNCAFSSITWFEEDLKANGITEVENIEFALRIYDENDWMADDFFYDKVTLNP